MIAQPNIVNRFLRCTGAMLKDLVTIPKMRRQLIACALLLPMVWVVTEKLVVKAGESFRIGFDPQINTCLPWRVYAVRPVTAATVGQIAVGDFVRFTVSESEAKNAPTFIGREFGKLVVAIAGDTVTVKDDLLFVNGRYWDRLWLNDRLKIAAGALDREFVVARGEVFLVATARNAFDGRYWGAIPATRVTGRVLPLF